MACRTGARVIEPQSLGYRVEDRALHVVEDEAEFVRSLFPDPTAISGKADTAG